MFLLFDIGGTHMRIAVSRDGKTMSDSVRVATPSTFEEGLNVLIEKSYMIAAGTRISVAVGGLAGSFDRDHEFLVNGGNVKAWIGKPLKKELERAFQAPVTLENDAALAGLGEALEGAGKDYDIVAYITVSTGMGGARITRKTIDQGRYGFEPGFQIIDAGRCLCSKCTKMHLGAHISGRGIEDQYHKKAEEITDSAIWDDIARHLAFGLNNTIVHWSPDIVVLGGAVMQSISIENVRRYVAEIMHIYPEIPLIERALLGDSGGLQGALQIARTIQIE